MKCALLMGLVLACVSLQGVTNRYVSFPTFIAELLALSCASVCGCHQRALAITMIIMSLFSLAALSMASAGER